MTFILLNPIILTLLELSADLMQLITFFLEILSSLRIPCSPVLCSILFCLVFFYLTGCSYLPLMLECSKLSLRCVFFIYTHPLVDIPAYLLETDTHMFPNEYTYPGSSPLSSRFIYIVALAAPSPFGRLIAISNSIMSKTELLTLQLPNASSVVFPISIDGHFRSCDPYVHHLPMAPLSTVRKKSKSLQWPIRPYPSSTPTTFLWITQAHAYLRAFALAASSI